MALPACCTDRSLRRERRSLLKGYLGQPEQRWLSRYGLANGMQQINQAGIRCKLSSQTAETGNVRAFDFCFECLFNQKLTLTLANISLIVNN